MIYGIASVVLFVLVVVGLYFIVLKNKNEKGNKVDNITRAENLIIEGTENNNQSKDALERFEKLGNDFLDFLGDRYAE